MNQHVLALVERLLRQEKIPLTEADSISDSLDSIPDSFGEKFLFRVGQQVDDALMFSADEASFLTELQRVCQEHEHDSHATLNIQVQTRTNSANLDWRNIQNPRTGGVVAITPEIHGNSAKLRETAKTLYLWAALAVQMMRDIEKMSQDLSSDTPESGPTDTPDASDPSDPYGLYGGF